MFDLVTTDFGGMCRRTLHHPELGHAFSVVPELGATLTELRFFGTNVLDGYETPEELREGKWGKSSLLFPFPNRLRDGTYTWLGETYSFPINNASTQNAIHGFVRHERFDEASFEVEKDHAEMHVQLDAPGTNPSYPFAFRLAVFFRMTADGEFLMRLRTQNRHPTPIPVGFGWHPYFRLAPRVDDHVLGLPDCQKVEIDERMIPTGARAPFGDFAEPRAIERASLDTCFRAAREDAPWEISLRAPGHSLVLGAEAKAFPFFQVFTPPKRDSIALEPMTCNVDALHNGEGLVSLPPGASWEVAFTVRYRAEG